MTQNKSYNSIDIARTYSVEVFDIILLRLLRVVYALTNKVFRNLKRRYFIDTNEEAKENSI